MNIVSNGGWNWASLYAEWKSEELQYYWRRLPLRLKPSAVDLAELAETAEPKEMRGKYAKILSLLEAEMGN